MKKTVFFLAATIIASPLWGEPIGENVAHRVVNRVLLQPSATLRSADDMPPNLRWWLGEYARQIQFVIENDIAPTQEISQQWAQYLGTNNNGKEE